LDIGKKDEYVGVSDPDISFRVTTSTGITDYKVEKNKPLNEYDNENYVVFSIKSAFTDFRPTDLKIDKSSGDIIQLGKRFGITQYFCPLHCEISYTVLVGLNRKRCRFIIDILEKGKFLININN